MSPGLNYTLPHKPGRALERLASLADVALCEWYKGLAAMAVESGVATFAGNFEGNRVVPIPRMPKPRPEDPTRDALPEAVTSIGQIPLFSADRVVSLLAQQDQAVVAKGVELDNVKRLLRDDVLDEEYSVSYSAEHEHPIEKARDTHHGGLRVLLPGRSRVLACSASVVMEEACCTIRGVVV